MTHISHGRLITTKDFYTGKTTKNMIDITQKLVVIEEFVKLKFKIILLLYET